MIVCALFWLSLALCVAYQAGAKDARDRIPTDPHIVFAEMPCRFDNEAIKGHRAVFSKEIPGWCHDAGAEDDFYEKGWTMGLVGQSGQSGERLLVRIPGSGTSFR